MDRHGRIQTILYREDGMRSRKLWMNIAGMAVLGLVGVAFYTSRVFDVGLWALWFAAFDGLVINYSVTNVAAKKVTG